MRVLDIITESKQQQIDELDLKKVGTAIGKGVSATTQGIGAVAGGVAGLPGAFKKGFKAGKDIVGGQNVDTSGATDYKLGKQSDGKFIYPGQETDSVTGKTLPKQSNTTKKVTTTGKQTAVSSTIEPSKITLTQVKQAVDKMRTRDKQSLLQYLQKTTQPQQTSQTPTVAPAVTTPPVKSPTVKVAGAKSTTKPKVNVAV